MSRKLLALLALAAVVSLATARVVREAPKPENTITEFFEKAEAGFNEFQQMLFKTMGVHNTEELNKKALDTGKEIVTKLDVWANNIKKETENLGDNENVKSLRATVEKLTADFTKEHPKTAEELKSFVESTKKQADEVIGKIKNLGESEETQKLKDISANLLTSAAETFQNMAKDVQESLKKE